MGLELRSGWLVTNEGESCIRMQQWMSPSRAIILRKVKKAPSILKQLSRLMVLCCHLSKYRLHQTVRSKERRIKVV